jgi:hypothetical protein
MVIEEQLEDVRARLFETGTETATALARANGLLLQAADEIRRLRNEAANVNLKIYTEAEAAEFFGIGESTLRRYRTSHEAWPHFRFGDLVKYTNFHLVEITEILDRRKERQAKKGKGTHLRTVEARAS